MTETYLSLFKGAIPIPGKVTMRSIAEETAREARLEPEELMGRAKRRAIAHPRQLAMYRMRQVRREDGTARYTFPQIGAFFDRDHSTAVHAVRAVERRMAEAAK